MRYKELTFEGRNAVLEAFRSGKTIDKLFILDGCQDGPIKSIVREAKKTSTIISYVDKERLDRLANTGHHQGVVAIGAAYEYAEVEDILKAAKDKGEAPFIFILDEIDTGLSGEVAHRMSLIMREMAGRMQVISISHLPQIAAAGNCHFKGYKEDRGETTISGIRKLTPEERVQEIAGMISGQEITPAAIETAKILLSAKAGN